MTGKYLFTIALAGALTGQPTGAPNPVPWRFPSTASQPATCVIALNAGALAGLMTGFHVLSNSQFPSVAWNHNMIAAVILAPDKTGRLPATPPSFVDTLAADGSTQKKAVFRLADPAATPGAATEVDVVELDRGRFGSAPACEVVSSHAAPEAQSLGIVIRTGSGTAVISGTRSVGQ